MKQSGSKVVWVSQWTAAGEHPCTGTVTKSKCAHQDGGYLGRFVCFDDELLRLGRIHPWSCLGNLKLGSEREQSFLLLSFVDLILEK